MKIHSICTKSKLTKTFQIFFISIRIHTGTHNNTNKITKFNTDRGWKTPAAVAVGA